MMYLFVVFSFNYMFRCDVKYGMIIKIKKLQLGLGQEFEEWLWNIGDNKEEMEK